MPFQRPDPMYVAQAWATGELIAAGAIGKGWLWSNAAERCELHLVLHGRPAVAVYWRGSYGLTRAMSASQSARRQPAGTAKGVGEQESSPVSYSSAWALSIDA